MTLLIAIIVMININYSKVQSVIFNSTNNYIYKTYYLVTTMHNFQISKTINIKL